MTTANKFTIARLIMVLPLIALMLTCLIMSAFNQHGGLPPQYKDIDIRLYLWISSAVIFLLAMITDFIDGYIARKTNTVTTFGKLFDPLADKFTTTSALIFLAVFRVVPVWMVILFVLRDILVDGSRNIAAKNNIDVSASIWGKAKTMLQSIGILLVFFMVPLLSKGVIDLSQKEFFENWRLILINIPLLLALIFSIMSGFLYFKQITPFINLK